MCVALPNESWLLRVATVSVPLAVGLSDAELVGTEVAMLGGLSYQLTAFHAFRPLKALLRACIGRYIAAGAGDAPDAPPAPGVTAGPHPALLSPDDPLFRSQWDALQVRPRVTCYVRGGRRSDSLLSPPLFSPLSQARAFALARASLASDLPLLCAPVDIAAAALSLAADAAFAVPPSFAHLGGSGSGGKQGDGGAGEEAADASVLSSAPAAIAWCVDGFILDSLTSVGGGPPAAGADAVRSRIASVRAQLHAAAVARPALPADVARLTERLIATANPQSVPGSEAAELQRRSLALERAAYKRGKAAARAHVSRINEAAMSGPAAAAAATEVVLDEG